MVIQKLSADILFQTRITITQIPKTIANNKTANPIGQKFYKHVVKNMVILNYYLMENNSKSNQIKTKRKVYLRCVFIKIYKVDTVNEFYSGEIFLHAKWREPLLDNKSDLKDISLSTFWNPKLSIENIFQITKSTTSLEVSFDEGNNKRAFVVEKTRIKAAFRETLELQHFPFDCQDLSISVGTEYSIEELEMAENPNDISKLNTLDGIESQEWNLYEHVEVENKIVINDCNFGPKERQIMTFTCRATRRFKYFLINHFMISSMFFLLTFSSFSIISTNTYGRLALCMTTLLTSVTFKVAVSQNLPKIPYLTYLDKTILGNILMIMLLCIWHAVTSFWFIDPSTNTTVAMSSLTNIENILIPTLLGFYLIAILTFAFIIYYDAGSRRREMTEKDNEFKSLSIKKENERLFCELD